MTGRRSLDDAALADALLDLGRNLAWPATPDLASRVTARLAEPAARGRRSWAAGILAAWATTGPGGRRTVRRGLLLALVALLALAAVAGAIGLGVPGIHIELGPGPGAGPTANPTVPTSTPGADRSATPSASPSGPAEVPPGSPNVGPFVTLDEARRSAGFAVVVPTVSGVTEPPEVHLQGTPPRARVSFVFGDRALVTEFLGAADPQAFEKFAGPGTTVEPIPLDGSTAYWITGAPHETGILYHYPDGGSDWQIVLVTGKVLIWQAGPVTFRLQTPLDREAALAIARSTY